MKILQKIVCGICARIAPLWSKITFCDFWLARLFALWCYLVAKTKSSRKNKTKKLLANNSSNEFKSAM
jgi:hypothetical protein